MNVDAIVARWTCFYVPGYTKAHVVINAHKRTLWCMKKFKVKFGSQ